MKTTRRITVAIAAGALGFGAFAIGPAAAVDGGSSESADTSKKSGQTSEREARKTARMEARKAARAFRIELRKAKRAARAAIKTCTIHPDKLVAVEDSKPLSRLAKNFAAKVEAGEWTQEKADAMLARAQQRVTLRSAMKYGRWAPMLELFGAESRRDLAMMLRKARGMRALMKEKGVSRVELVAAKRAGKVYSYKKVAYYCTSGAEEEKTTEPGTGEEETSTPAE